MSTTRKNQPQTKQRPQLEVVSRSPLVTIERLCIGGSIHMGRLRTMVDSALAGRKAGSPCMGPSRTLRDALISKLQGTSALVQPAIQRELRRLARGE